MTLGEQIKTLRKQRGWTRDELAARVGVTGAYLSMLESGRRTNPARDVLHRLADTLGVSVAELEGENDILNGPWPAATMQALGLDEAFLLRYSRLWADLSREDRAWLIGHLRILADAERRVQALERAARDHPDGAAPAGAESVLVVPDMIAKALMS